MSTRNGISTGIAFALLATFSSAVVGHEAVTTTTAVLKYAPNSEGAYSVASWLEARTQQGQFNRSGKLSPVSGASIVVEISTMSTSDEVTHGAPCGPNSCTPFETSLPLTGTTGEQVTIIDCIPGGYAEEVTYNWPCDANGCHWQQISYVLKMNRSITCGGA